MFALAKGVVDDSVWFVKSHFPDRHGWKSFRAHKCILVVTLSLCYEMEAEMRLIDRLSQIRNPYDAIDSYFNMILTKTHNKSIHESQYARFADIWDKLIKNEIEVW